MTYVKRKGKKLLDSKGNEFLLRGVGLGGWLLPEGYMWHLPEAGDRPWKMEVFIEQHLGKDYSDYFWQTYKKRFISEQDIKLIHEAGFNSIRLPFNSRHIFKNGILNEEEMTYIDQVITWCERYKLYVILDMHGAPGGQTGTNIDDSRNNQPELFISEVYQDQAIEIWRQLALRYKDNPWIAGFDLLNEPLPEWFSEHNDKLIPLYKKMIKAIRSVNKNHMIILEGLHWSTDLSIFTERLDENILIQFHKYWNNPDQESIQSHLDLRDKLDAPLFMGEGGENNLDWYTGAFHLYESFDISWNFWTYKKMDNTNSLISVKKPKDWDLMTQYLNGEVEVDTSKLKGLLDTFLKNIHFDKCHYNKSVTHALMRQVPVSIPAIFYDYGGKGVSYLSNYKGNEKIGFRRNDDLSIQLINNSQSEIRFNHGDGSLWDDNRACVLLEEEDWVKYTFKSKTKKVRSMTIQLKIQSKTDLEITSNEDGKVILGLEECKDSLVKADLITHEEDTVTIKVLKGCVCIERINVED